MVRVFDFKDVQLIPKQGILQSRSQAEVGLKLGDFTFEIPVVPANMATVIDEFLAEQLAENNYFYIMHRFEPAKREQFVRKMNAKNLVVSVSVGVKASEFEWIKEMASKKYQIDFITIDIAHGYCEPVAQMIKHIKSYLPTTFVIAGNVATPDAVQYLEAAGADATKVGIGPGKACITKKKTGFGTAGWQLSAIAECAKIATKPIIADGGLRENGDIAKALKFGAHLCMVGSMLAGHKENPGLEITIDGKQYKQYYGSASAKQKGNRHHVEGRELLIEYKGSIFETLAEMKEDLQSAVSYAGGKDLTSLKDVDYVILNS